MKDCTHRDYKIETLEQEVDSLRKQVFSLQMNVRSIIEVLYSVDKDSLNVASAISWHVLQKEAEAFDEESEKIEELKKKEGAS